MTVSRRIMSRLLLLNKPVLQRSDAEVTAEAEQNYSWNFTMSILNGASFWFGIAFASSATIVPLFVSKVTLNPLVFGIVAMIAQASWFLPQLLASGATERSDRKKPIVVNLGFFTERLPVILWPLAPIITVFAPIAGLLFFLLTYLWHGLGAGIIGPAWTDLIARCFPVNRRGRMFGITSFIGTGMGTAGALLSGRILSTFAYPWSFVIVFGIAGSFIMISWIFLAMLREPEQKSTVSRESQGPVRARMGRILSMDDNFRHFLIYRVTIVAAAMGTGFLTVVAIERWNVADGVVGYYTAMLLLGQTGGSLLAGMLADRVGHKIPLAIGAVAQITGFTLAIVGRSPSSYYLVFGLVGFAIGVHTVSGILAPLEFARVEQRPTYVGITNTFAGVASVFAPLVGGYLASTSFHMLFSACVVIGLAALIWLVVGVRDPRTVQIEPAPVAP